MKTFLWAGRKIKLKNLELLKEVAREAQINLEMVSNIPHTELQEKIRNCYAVILPSYSECCPNFILEAVSLGNPFIVTEESGLREIYNKGGIFINPFDRKALKQGILEMLDESKYESFKKELEEIHKSRNWGEVAKEFLSLCQ